MYDLQQTIQDLEKVGFRKGDTLSAQKLLHLCQQLEAFDVPFEKAKTAILKTFANERKNNAKHGIEIFCQSDINGSYFDFKAKMKELKEDGAFFGFNPQNFVGAAMENPSLIFINPQAVVKKVKFIEENYADKGFSGKDFFKIACEFPSLLGNDSNSIEKKIEELHNFFGSYGVTWDALFTGIKKQSRLLSVDPNTVIRHAHILLNAHQKGFWRIGNNAQETPVQVLTAILVTRPIGLNLSDKNLRMRRIYALLENENKTEKLKLGTYLRSKKSLAPILSDGLIKRGRHSLLNRLFNQGYLETHKHEAKQRD